MSIVKSAKLWQKKNLIGQKLVKLRKQPWGKKYLEKKNSRNYPRFHAGHVRKKLWSHFMQ